MSKTRNIQGIELLRFNHAGAMQLNDGHTVNYGVIRVNDNEVVYYTGKGLREMWKPTMTEEEKKLAGQLKQIGETEGGEQKLISSEHIAITSLDDIVRVIF
ncbi:MAG: hypothetical protein H0X63_08180 [Flavobacteriales bacterium]|nr:hypothetical protein [Flavobacteriales bacterium]